MIRRAVLLIAAFAIVTTACSPSTPTPKHLTLAQLGEVSIGHGAGRVQLHHGRAEVSYGGASKDAYFLAGIYADGDVDGDGRPDAAVILVTDSAGSGTFRDLVLVLNKPGGPQAQEPLDLGDRVVIQSLSILRGSVQISLLDRTEGTALSEVDRQSSLTWSWKSGRLTKTRDDTTPLTEVPLPVGDPEIRTTTVTDGGRPVTVHGQVAYGQRQQFALTARAGQRLRADLIDPPLGLFLTVTDPAGHRLGAPTARVTSLDANLPTTGHWQVQVVSLNGATASYRLTMQLSAGSSNAASSALHPFPPGPSPAAGRKVLYLTFDDGPNPPYTNQVLALLARYGAKATFFDVGSQLQRYPALLAAELAAGNSVGNHTQNHTSLAGLSQSQFDADVKPVKTLLGSRGSNCLRPPYGASDGFTRDYAAALGYRLQHWDIDTRDWARPGVDQIVNAVLEGARNGAVVLMHDGGGNRDQTIAALTRILPALHAQGWTLPVLC